MAPSQRLHYGTCRYRFQSPPLARVGVWPDAGRIHCDLSVLTPALDEGPNLIILLPWLTKVLDELDICYEIIVITKEGDHETIRPPMMQGRWACCRSRRGTAVP